MTKLLEIKEKVFRFWGEYEVYLKFVYKFVIALMLFSLINESIGFMESISTFSVALLLALVCCLLPQSMTLLVAAGATNEDVCHVAYGYGLFTGGAGLHGGSHKVTHWY